MGFDYADQRYYAAAYGRFNTADPMAASASAGDPGSWNRYAYVGGDPINGNDPSGMIHRCLDDDPEVLEGWLSPGDDGCTDNQANGGVDPCALINIGMAWGNSQGANCTATVITVLWTPPTKPTKPKCPDNIMNFFNIMIPLASNMADTLDSSTNDILALSAFESGWLDPHNQALHNPFGLTNAGGNNLNFSGGYQAAAYYWIKNDGQYVQGVKDIGQFAADLQPHYNVVNPKWTSTLGNVFKSILKWRAICGK